MTWGMTPALALAWILSALFGLGLPLILIFVRNSIRDRRQIYVAHLQKTLFAGKDNPSFEFVKHRYFCNGDEKGHKIPSWSLLFARFARPFAKQRYFVDGHRKGNDIRTWHLLLAALPLFIVSALGIYLVFAPIADLLGFGGADTILPPIVPTFLWASAAKLSPDTLSSAAAAGAIAFLGGYYATIRQLVRSTVNFDLTPATLLRETIRLLGGFVLGVVVWRVVGPDGLGNIIGSGNNVTTNTLWIPVIFWIGYAPDFGLATLLSYLRVHWFKTVDTEVLRAVPALPLEIISGIDYDTRYRLEETNISDVQNLATFNPIQLHVETPFGLYQAIDWVAQAQLCCAVGAKSFVQLRKANIRTILDLERAVLSPESTPELRQFVATLAFAELDNSERDLLRVARVNGANPRFDDATIRQAVRLATDDLHVHRLRQLWQAIGSKLGRKSAWLKFDDEVAAVRGQQAAPAADASELPGEAAATTSMRHPNPAKDDSAAAAWAAANRPDEATPAEMASPPIAPHTAIAQANGHSSDAVAPADDPRGTPRADA